MLTNMYAPPPVEHNLCDECQSTLR